MEIDKKKEEAHTTFDRHDPRLPVSNSNNTTKCWKYCCSYRRLHWVHLHAIRRIVTVKPRNALSIFVSKIIAGLVLMTVFRAVRVTRVSITTASPAQILPTTLAGAIHCAKRSCPSISGPRVVALQHQMDSCVDLADRVNPDYA
jgi:hypothetical protein